MYNKFIESTGNVCPNIQALWIMRRSDRNFGQFFYSTEQAYEQVLYLLREADRR